MKTASQSLPHRTSCLKHESTLTGIILNFRSRRQTRDLVLQFPSSLTSSVLHSFCFCVSWFGTTYTKPGQAEHQRQQLGTDNQPPKCFGEFLPPERLGENNISSGFGPKCFSFSHTGDTDQRKERNLRVPKVRTFLEALDAQANTTTTAGKTHDFLTLPTLLNPEI